MQEDPKTVQHLLELIRTTRAEWDSLIKSLPRSTLTEPGVVNNEWSLKDILAHVTWGEREMIPVIREMRLQGSDLWNLDTDARNAAMIAEAKDKSLDQVLKEHDSVYNEMVAAIEKLEDADLVENARLKDAPPSWTLWELVAGNTFRHYPEHVAWTREWLGLPPDQQTKAQLLSDIAASRAKFEALINSLSDAQLTQPGPDGGWSIKDHLAHLATWEAGVAALLRRQPRWAAMGLDETKVKSMSEEEINAAIEQNHKGLSLSEVKDLFARAHRDLVAAVESLKDNELYKGTNYFLPDGSGRSVIHLILGNTNGHWDEHTEWIHNLIEHAY